MDVRVQCSVNVFVCSLSCRIYFAKSKLTWHHRYTHVYALICDCVGRRLFNLMTSVYRQMLVSFFISLLLARIVVLKTRFTSSDPPAMIHFCVSALLEYLYYVYTNACPTLPYIQSLCRIWKNHCTLFTCICRCCVPFYVFIMKHYGRTNAHTHTCEFWYWRVISQPQNKYLCVCWHSFSLCVGWKGIVNNQ